MPELGTCKLSRQPSLRLKQHLAHGWELDGESAGERGAATRAEERRGGGGGSAPFLGWCAGCAVGVGGGQARGRRRVAAACHHPSEPFAVAAFATTTLNP